MAELDRRGISAVLSANSDLEVRLRAPAAFDSNAHQLSHAVEVEGGERLGWKDLPIEVERQKLSRIVPRDAERRLREVIRSVAEELGVLGDSIGEERRPGPVSYTHLALPTNREV